MSESKKVGTRKTLNQLDQQKAAAAAKLNQIEAEEAQNRKLEDSSESDNSSTGSLSDDTSANDSSDSDSDNLTTSGDGLIRKRYKTIPMADKVIFKDFENLMSRLAQLPSEISNKGGYIYNNFGMDLRDWNIRIKEVIRNQTENQTKLVRKTEKIQMKKIKLLGKTIYSDLFEENYGTLGASLISIMKEGPFVKEILGRRQTSKILQQLKSIAKNYQSVSNANLRQIPSWKKFEKKRSFSTKKGENSKKFVPEKRKKD